MSEITLEKIDIIRERTGASYSVCKEAMEASAGDVVEALIYLENNKVSKMEEIFNSKEEFINRIKELINKGNVNRIRVKKEDKIVLDVPVNAGIATGMVGLIFTPLLAILGVGTMTAMFTNYTVEITKTDGSVEIVNTIVKNTANTVKSKVANMKDKFSFNKSNKEKNNDLEDDYKEENVYKYTVKFDDIDDEK